MRASRGKDLVSAAALLAALALGGFQLARARGWLGAHWSDGARRFASETGADVRHVLWEAPEPLGELGSASDPTLSPDGRWLVFASGARGLNQELYAAELAHGSADEPRALSALNSASDECAPAFADGWLYFASDRAGGAGGLDLWRAPYRDGEFGSPELLAPGLNSSADETDPAPWPGRAALVFASNRAGADLDLYLAAPDADGFFAVEALELLSSPGIDDGPAFARDGRSLWFASERAGGAGRRDLLRALRFGERWEAPQSVAELASAADEHAPWLAGDGFELVFARDDVLVRARSRELFRTPAPRLGLAEVLTLVALLVLALLAQLAKRWRALDVLYKCFLVSLVLHLLLLYFLRRVVPEERVYAPGASEEPAVRVRLAPSEPVLEAGLGGAAAPLARAAFAAEVPAAAPRTAELVAPPAALPETPAPRASAPAESAAPAVALAAPNEPTTRRGGAAPELALAARVAPAASIESTAPERAASASTTPVARPSAALLAAESVSELQSAGAPARAPRAAPASEPTTAPLLASPREEAPRQGGAAPELALLARPAPAPSASASMPRVEPREARTELGPAVRPAPLALGAAAASMETAQELGDLPRAKAATRPAPREEGALGTALRAPVADGSSAPSTPAPAPTFDALAGLTPARASTRASAAPPARPRAEPRRELAVPEPARPQPLALASPEPADLAEAAPRAPRLAESPYQNRFGAQKLRALEEFGGTQASEDAVVAGLAYLAQIQGADGAWGSRRDEHEKYLDVRIGKSALALLAFLGAGHVPGGDGAHADVARRAVAFLLSTQDEASGHFGRSCAYGHGIATYALAECYALTAAPELRAPLERGLAQILRNQAGGRDPRVAGGWGYYYADGRVWNGDEWPRTSVTAWQVMALESARLGGLAVPDEAFARAREFLVSAWDERRGAFRYAHDPERLSSGYPILPASTPGALFALALLGLDPRADELAAARRYVLARAPDGYRYSGADDFVFEARGNPYFWYYGTLALFRVGGREWQRWNAALQATLLPAQEPDGSWRPIDVYAEYAGDDEDERTYATATAVLSLEIYYRYFTPLLVVR